MKLRFISYGHKFYEAEGREAPKHDFLFSLRDLKNPYWVPELKEYNGLDKAIIDFFEIDNEIQDRLKNISNLILAFIRDFAKNESRLDSDELCFAFKCTGGKHRSVYFAEEVYKKISEALKGENQSSRSFQLEVEHVDLPKYIKAGA